jgi:hypothetical protein
MGNEKKTFFLKLNPPRATFMADMTAEEKGVMQKHVAYWAPYVNDGTVVVLGPVMDPKTSAHLWTSLNHFISGWWHYRLCYFYEAGVNGFAIGFALVVGCGVGIGRRDHISRCAHQF